RRLTDDRGIYRFYGLAPGIYLVCAGGGLSRYYSGFNKYEEEVSTFYPSSPRRMAEEIRVGAGQEAAGIDIVYRGENGHVVSGVAGVSDIPHNGPTVAVVLADWSTGEVRNLGPALPNGSFSFSGVPDGDYYLTARYLPGDGRNGAMSGLYRIKVS